MQYGTPECLAFQMPFGTKLFYKNVGDFTGSPKSACSRGRVGELFTAKERIDRKEVLVLREFFRADGDVSVPRGYELMTSENIGNQMINHSCTFYSLFNSRKSGPPMEKRQTG